MASAPPCTCGLSAAAAVSKPRGSQCTTPESSGSTARGADLRERDRGAAAKEANASTEAARRTAANRTIGPRMCLGNPPNTARRKPNTLHSGDSVRAAAGSGLLWLAGTRRPRGGCGLAGAPRQKTERRHDAHAGEQLDRRGLGPPRGGRGGAL
eukprot:scaffold77814_cov67-Phaeocystis_antarctica.AAC.12